MIEKYLSEIKTPAYVFDIPSLKERAQKMRGILKGIKLCYAMKANPFLIKELKNEVDCFEVCSHGEFRICKSKNIPAEKIVYSGVNKSEKETEEAVLYCKDKAVYTVESVLQYRLLQTLAEKFSLKLHVVFRLSSFNQFGMDEETILSLLEKSKDSALVFEGIQYYSGTQKKAEKIEKEIGMLKGFLSSIREKGYSVNRLEYGPGLPVSYFEGENMISDMEFLQRVSEELRENFDVKTVLETGRFLVADCGMYITGIADVKTNFSQKFVIVDGGINHLNYYNQMMAMKKPIIEHFKAGKRQERGTEEYTICGSLCTTADVLVRNYPLENAEIGDVLAFYKAGAYSVTEGIYLFLSRDMPRIYKIAEDGCVRLVRDGLQTDPING